MDHAEARYLVKKAIKEGKLVRPFICENCLSFRDDIQAHHDDYSEPLEVRWLCPHCHYELHKKMGVKRGPRKLRPVMFGRVINHSGSLYVCLPKPYCQKEHVQPGNKVVVIDQVDYLEVIPLRKRAGA